jgi:hypothetical protein
MPEESKQGAELRLHLVIDDGTQETLNKLREGLGEVEGHTKTIETNSHEIAKGVFEGQMYWEATKKIIEGIEEGIKAAYEIAEKFADEAVHAASAAQEQERAMTGLFHMMDQGKNSMGGLALFADETREHLEEAGLQAGVATKSMVDMFSTIVERGQLSSKAAEELTMQMADVGKITRGGMQGLAEGFAMIELGIVRARNPLVQLISTMGLLHGNAKEVAQQMLKLAPEKQMEMAQKAVEKQAEALKKSGGIELTLPELKTSFEGFREMFFESVGAPMMDVIMPMLTRVQGFLVQNAEVIKQWGHDIGEEFASGIEVLENIGGGIYNAVHENWDEIKHTMLDATAGLRSAWDSIKDNQQAIAGTFKDITKDLLGVASWLAAHSPGAGEQAPDMKALHSAASDPSKLALHGGDSELGKMEDALHARMGQQSDDDRTEIANINARATATAAWARQMEEYGNKVTEAQDHWIEAGKNNEDLNADMQGASDAFADNVREAATRGDVAMEQWAATFVSKNSDLAMSLIQAKDKIGPAFDDFAKMVEEHGGDIAELFKRARGKPGELPKGAGGAAIHMSGGQTFNIKQDYRDQDPDRILIAFRRDLVKHSVARIASAFTPMGGI